MLLPALLLSGFSSLALVALAVGLWRMGERHKAALEGLAKIQADQLERLLVFWRDTAHIGGLPPELWREQHSLQKQQQALSERRLDFELEMKKKSFEAQEDLLKRRAQRDAFTGRPAARITQG